MSIVTRAVALAKANPALAIAGVGVGGVLLLPLIRPKPAEEPPPPAVYGAGYGAALTTGSSLDAQDLGTQLNESTNVLLGQQSAILRELQANRQPLPATPPPPAPAPKPADTPPTSSGSSGLSAAYKYALALFQAGHGPNPGSFATWSSRLSGQRTPYQDVRRNAYNYAQAQYAAGKAPNPGSFATWASKL